MEGHRSYPESGYSDSGYTDSGSWHSERGYERGYGGEARYGGGEYGGGAEYGPDYGGGAEYGTDYGLPDPRRSDPEPSRPLSDPGRVPVEPVARAASVGPRSGLPIPEDPAARRGPVSPQSASPAGEMYRSRRPATAALFGVAALLLEIPALLLLIEAAFRDPVIASEVVAAISVMAALPLVAVGLYAVATGAVRAAGPNSAQAWLRPPVAYLSVGLVLFVAAGLAA